MIEKTTLGHYLKKDRTANKKIKTNNIKINRTNYYRPIRITPNHQVPAYVINNICHFRKSFNAQYFNVREVKRQRNGNVKVYSLMLDHLTFGKLSTIHLEGAVTDMRYFARSTFSKSLVHKKKKIGMI